MNVNNLRDRILEISHDEDAPDTHLKNKAMEWVNSAYHELMDELTPFMGDKLQRLETVTLNNGVASLLNQPFRVLKVLRTRDNYLLKATNLSEQLNKQTALNTNGDPSKYWMNGSSIQTYPISNEQISVLYVPVVTDLIEGGDEASIMLPKTFHHALVWGGLVWSSVFERGFSTQAELTLFQRKWDEAKQKIKLSMAASETARLTVSSYEF